ncbi:MAG TPA: hypothetical protein VHV57_17320 [Acidimicrobiales bacterium]|jgi:hypothetical protein|nr:hypothetical protein [Acidimicrobiales bacterium]
MDSGVKVVGGESSSEEPASVTAPPAAVETDAASGDGGSNRPPPPAKGRGAAVPDPGLRRFTIATMAAVLGLIGTLVFGGLWLTEGGSGEQDTAVLSAARTFLSDLTNFNAKTVDADFSSVTDMATGTFGSQAKKFFNSAIRTELEKALAESRGQIRSVYVQTKTATSASVYGVVDQLYVNSKITTPQADVLRVVVNLQLVDSTWKISNVTVLEGATPASEGSASGSAGSSVPGQ